MEIENVEPESEIINNEVYQALKSRIGRNRLRIILGLTPEQPTEDGEENE